MEQAVVCEHADEQPKPVDIVWASSKPKKKRQDIVKIIERVISLILGPAVAITALMFSLNPTLNRRNMNYEQRALAGDIAAQMFLADYSYMIGDFASSILYYTMVAKQPKIETDSDRTNLLMAYNNLGHLYLTKINNKDSRSIALFYLDKGMRVLMQFIDLPSCGETLIKSYLIATLSSGDIDDEIIKEYLEQNEQSRLVDKSYEALYNNDPKFKMLYDYNVISSGKHYFFLCSGFWFDDVIYCADENDEEISGSAKTKWERDLLSELGSLLGIDFKLYLSDYYGIHEDYLDSWFYAPRDMLGVEEGDILVEEYLIELEAQLEAQHYFNGIGKHYAVYKKLAKSNAYRYTSYINSVDL